MFNEDFTQEGLPYENIDPEILENQQRENEKNSYSKTLGESHIVYAEVQIKGQDFSKENNLEVYIHENTLEHTDFQILVPSEAFGERDDLPLSQSRKYLGSHVTIQFIQFGKAVYIYTGLITEITNQRKYGYSYVCLSGKSTTILLDNGLRSQSFEKKTLEEIVKTIIQEAELTSNLIDFKIQPHFKDPIHYTVQYRESDFQFLRRLAIRYGEWFLYDGQRLIFGGYGGKTVDMLEQQDIEEYNIKIQAQPQYFSYISYDSRQRTIHTVDSETAALQSPVNPFQFEALKSSEKLFRQTAETDYNKSLLNNGEWELKQIVKRQKESRQNLVHLTAKSWNPEIKLGDIVCLKAWMPGHEIFDDGEVPLESYRIIELKHYHNGVNGYYNEFMAIPRDNMTTPYLDEEYLQKAEEQSAIVVDNNDPEQMNRIRVQFPWQKSKNQQTPWIWMIQAHAGAGKGAHFIPEKGEEVMVAFESGNMEKPYVIGTRYNGKEKSGYHTPGNDKKVIHTRSGTRIILNDAEGSVFIEDPSGNTYLMDGEGNVNIYAPKNMTLTTGEDFFLNVGRDMKVDIGNDQDYFIAKNHRFTSATYTQKVEGNKEITVGGALLETTSTTTHKAIDGDYWVQSAGISTILGAVDAKLNKG